MARLALVRRRINASGGGEWFMREMARGLLARGHEVHLLAEEADTTLTGDVHIHTAALPPGHSSAYAHAYRAFVAATLEPFAPVTVISGERAVAGDIYRAGDGAHGAWLERHAAAAGNAFARLLIQKHPRHQRQVHLENALFASPRLRLVIANSRLVRDDLQRFHPRFPAENYRIIYNALDLLPYYTFMAEHSVTACRAGLGLPADRPVIFFAGANFQRKGLLALLEAAPAIAALRPYLVIAGKGDTGALRGAMRALPPGIDVRLCGPQPELKPYYRAADLFVLPTMYDPFSNVCLEAMAMEVPVITTATNGFAEVIRRHQVGAVIGEDGPLPDLLHRLLAADAQQALRARIRDCRAAYDLLPFLLQLEDAIAAAGGSPGA